jgi:arylformamidase
MPVPRERGSGFRILDISRTLEPATAVWPGDQPFGISWTARIAEGSSVNLTCLRGSPHVGTHTDAPLHVRDGAPGVGELDLAPYLGPCRVLEATADPGGLIQPSGLAGLEPGHPPRLLLKTGTDPDPRRWPERFAALAVETARFLGRSGVILVGLDTPSLDPPDSKSLPAHHALIDAGLRWLENLDLTRVAPGDYELVALPLKIAGGEASPVRAILIERNDAASAGAG